MPVQQTFTLVPKNPAPNARVTTRPMTSKQVKKAHKATHKGPKLSRQEQRRLDLAEQERIRKELEKEKQAARARAARERKKEKEVAEREAKKKSGGPLVAPRASQDLISRFVRGNGVGKNSNGRGGPVEEMQVLEEAHKENPEPADPVEKHPSKSPTPDGEGDPFSGDATEAPEKVGIDTEAVSDNLQETGDKDTSESHGEDAGTSFSTAYDGSFGEEMMKAVSMRVAPKMMNNDHGGAHENTTAKETHGSKSTITDADGPKHDIITEQPGVLDDVEQQETAPQDVLPTEITTNMIDDTSGPPCTQYDGILDDDTLFLLSRHEMYEQGSYESQQMIEKHIEGPASVALEPQLPPPKMVTNDARSTPPSEEQFDDLDGMDDVTEEEIRMLTSPTKQARQSEQEDFVPGGMRQLKPPRLESHSSNSLDLLADELDDEIILNIDNAIRNESPSKYCTGPAKSHSIAAPVPKGPEPPSKRRCTATSYEDDLGLARTTTLPSPPPLPPHHQLPPLSTQAILGNFDDFFPTSSQQARELDDEDDVQPSPCLPGPMPLPPPCPQKRFFTSSGTSERISLAMLRSRRDVARDDLRREEKERMAVTPPAQKIMVEGDCMGPPLKPPLKMDFSTPRGPSVSTPNPPFKPTLNPPTALRRPLLPRTLNATLKRPVSRSSESPHKSEFKRSYMHHPPAQGVIAPPPVPQKARQLNNHPPRVHQPSSATRPQTPAGQVGRPGSWGDSKQRRTPSQEGGKENKAPPSASQSSEYGGDWMDDIDVDLVA